LDNLTPESQQIFLAPQDPNQGTADEPVSENLTHVYEYDTHIIDSRGDLWVLVHGTGLWGSSKPLRLKVCSRALSRASLVFEKMLYGTFSESKHHRTSEDAEDDWEISLPEMPPLGVRQLFEIMHCRFVKLESEKPASQNKSGAGNGREKPGNNAILTDAPVVPEEAVPRAEVVAEEKHHSAACGTCIDATSGEVEQPCTAARQIYDLVVAADFLNCIAILRPWVSRWLTELKSSKSDREELMRKAWIYYQLGCQTGYEAIVYNLAIKFRADIEPATSKGETAPLPGILPDNFLRE